MNHIYAICGAAFIVAMSFIAIGGGASPRDVAAFLFAAALSQFFAQGDNIVTYVLSIIAAVASLVLAVMIIVTL